MTEPSPSRRLNTNSFPLDAPQYLSLLNPPPPSFPALEHCAATDS